MIKLHLKLLICGIISVMQINAHNNDDFSCLLVTSERNSIRFERYEMKDMRENTVYLTREECDKHCILELTMNEVGAGVHGAQWDPANVCSMIIKAGKRMSPISYELDIMSLFDRALADQASCVCFDCSMIPVDECVRNRSDANSWISCAHMEMPLDTGLVNVQFVFDRKIRSVCGMFVLDTLFSAPLRFSGVMKKRVALDRGLLRMVTLEKGQPTLGTPSCSMVKTTTLQAGEQAILDQVGTVIQVAENVAEQQLLNQEEALINQELPTVLGSTILGTVQQQTVAVFQLINQYIANAWNSFTSYIVGSK